MSKRRSLVAANWKMNGSLESIGQLVGAISQGVTQGTEVRGAYLPAVCIYR